MNIVSKFQPDVVYCLELPRKMLKDMFELFDTDKSGYLSSDELTVIFNSIGYYPSQEWLTETLLNFDTDGNDGVDFDEFVLMCNAFQNQRVMEPEIAIHDALR